MTASALVTIFCDAPACGSWDDAGVAPTASEARDGLRRARSGWTLAVPDPNGGRQRLDFCPRHAGAVPREEGA